MELPGMVKQEPVDTSYDTSTDPHCVPSAVGCPQQAMQKVPDITDLSDPESSLGEYKHQHHLAARGAHHEVYHGNCIAALGDLLSVCIGGIN